MERIWLDHYPPGVPADIDTSPYQSLLTMLDESCRRFADRPAYTSLGVTISYAELDRLSRDFAAWLQSRGMRQGDRVALMLPNLLQYPVCLFGALRAGCVVVNCNPLYTAHELAHQLKDAGALAIVIADNFAHTLQKALLHTSLRHIVTTSIGELLGPVKGRVVDFVVRHIKRKVPAWSLPGTIRLRAALAAGHGQTLQPPTLTRADPAFLQYTGGTTGVAKAAVLSHGNMLANLCQAHAWIRAHLRDGEECIVTALPLYHVFALTANCLTFIKLGARNLL